MDIVKFIIKQEDLDEKHPWSFSIKANVRTQFEKYGY